LSAHLYRWAPLRLAFPIFGGDRMTFLVQEAPKNEDGSFATVGATFDELSVLLVEDHALVRRGFRRLLEDDAQIRIAGEARDGEEAVDLAGTLHPTVAIVDCALPRMSGLDTIGQIRGVSPQTAVLMLSMHSENTWVQRALKSGARGYILKNAVDLDLVAAVKDVAAGRIVIDPQLMLAPPLKGERSCGLTPRELQVLQLIADGKSNKEIANHLSLSPNTVAVHRANMMQALQLHNAAELVAYAIRNGLVNPV
jgi:DNA-binding NarL/FixJ family response regulator